jgi:hypothetical protein
MHQKFRVEGNPLGVYELLGCRVAKGRRRKLLCIFGEGKIWGE